MTAHTYSLSPKRFPDETMEEYKERRAGLSKMADRAGRWGIRRYNPDANQYKDPVTGEIKTKPYIRNDKDE